MTHDENAPDDAEVGNPGFVGFARALNALAGRDPASGVSRDMLGNGVYATRDHDADDPHVQDDA